MQRSACVDIVESAGRRRVWCRRRDYAGGGPDNWLCLHLCSARLVLSALNSAALNARRFEVQARFDEARFRG